MITPRPRPARLRLGPAKAVVKSPFRKNAAADARCRSRWRDGQAGVDCGLRRPRHRRAARHRRRRRGQLPYVAGYFEGEIDFGDPIGKRKSAGGSDAFVVKIDANGKVAWAQTFGAKRDDAANAIAVHGDTVVVVGNYLNELKIGDFDKKARAGSAWFRRPGKPGARLG